MKYFRALIISIAALFLCSQPQNLATRTSSTKSEARESAPALQLLWKQDIGVARALAISPNGGYIAIVGDEGILRCLDKNGNPVWKVSIEGIDRVAVSDDASALAYAYLNPAATEVHLIGPDGEVRWSHEMKGAAWAVAASPDPGVFAAGTGERYCYIYTLSGGKRRYRRWKLPGVPCTASFSPDGRSIVFGTWQDAGVGVFEPDGSRIKWRSGQSDRLYSVELSSKGGYMIVTAKPNWSMPEAAVYLRNRDLDDLWSKSFPAQGLSIDLSANGEFVAVGYERVIAHKDKEIRENRIALYNRSGDRLWEKGGLFGKWNLLQVSRSGRLLLYDESGSIYALSRSGEILLKRKLPATVRMFVRNPSRSNLAVYCGDGQLCSFSAR